MLLIIDNYDSFTYNLVHYFEALNQGVKVARNNEINISQIASLKPAHIVLSPGPGRPEDAGITKQVIGHFGGKIPILGVCLGHQAIAQHFGAKIITAKEIKHGKTSRVFHNNSGVFSELPNPLTAARYHSLVIDKKTLPTNLEITAWTTDKNNQFEEIMAIKHKQLPIQGVQFHPEAILSEAGLSLLNNFIKGDKE